LRIRSAIQFGVAHEREQESGYEIRLAEALGDARERLQAVEELLVNKARKDSLTSAESEILALANGRAAMTDARREAVIKTEALLDGAVISGFLNRTTVLGFLHDAGAAHKQEHGNVVTSKEAELAIKLVTANERLRAVVERIDKGEANRDETEIVLEDVRSLAGGGPVMGGVTRLEAQLAIKLATADERLQDVVEWAETTVSLAGSGCTNEELGKVRAAHKILALARGEARDDS
jgi:hypothetical protein